jgi:PKD repeat protein
VLAAALALLLVVTGGPASAKAEEFRTDPTTGDVFDQSPVSADVLPTPQINGVVWDQEVTDTRVYVGGDFTTARPFGSAAGKNTVPRTNLLSYDIETGELDTKWAPNPNGRVFEVTESPDGSRIYVGGVFTQMNGVTRERVAALDPKTGELDTSWAPRVNGRVDGITIKGDIVYIVGMFSQVNGVARTRVAAVSATTGAVLPFTANPAGGYGVKGIVISPDGNKAVIVGDFQTTNGSATPGRGMAALDTKTNKLLPWAANSLLRNAYSNSGFEQVTADENSVFTVGQARGAWEGSARMSWEDGSITWMTDCHGDSYDIAPVAGAVFVSSHMHYCGNLQGSPEGIRTEYYHANAYSYEPTGSKLTTDNFGYNAYPGQQAPRPLNWYPRFQIGTYTGRSQATWTVEGNDKYVVYGGEFLSVSGIAQQGLVRFATRDIAPNKVGPSSQGADWKLNATSYVRGEARLSWQANYDLDSSKLTYELYRTDLPDPIYTTTALSTHWIRPTLGFTDKNLTPGAKYEYQVRVRDDDGNRTRTDPTSVTIATSGTTTPYNDAVLKSTPRHYWPLSEASGTTAIDRVASWNMTLTGATRNAAGHQVGVTSAATTFSGSSSSYASNRSNPDLALPQQTVELWFKTTTTSGGVLAGFSTAATGTGGSTNPNIYMASNGTISLAAYPNGVQTVTTPYRYNDDRWYHLVATVSQAGQQLWINGQLRGENKSGKYPKISTGYWRVAGSGPSGLPNAGSSLFFKGQISDVAVYDRVLSRAEMNDHWKASGRASLFPEAPSDPYGAAVHAFDPTLHWRLTEPSNVTTAADSGMSANPGTYRGTVGRGATGPLVTGPSSAVSFTNAQQVTGNTQFSAPTEFAAEAWFNTTSTTGGKIIGFGNSATATNSTTADRHVYMDAQGRLYFGVLVGTSRVTISTTGSLNDGEWHHVVAQLSPTRGMELYVDGALVGANVNKTATVYNGYWRIGGDTSWAGDNGFDGLIAEAAVYRTALPYSEVSAHNDLGRFGVVNQAPKAAFTTNIKETTLKVDASNSTDADGTVAGYAWDFGDGTTGSGKTATHVYAEPGRYTVKLTVVDDRGATHRTQTTVMAQPVNSRPVSEFTAKANLLDVEFDGSRSRDRDGEIVSHSWAFGDGNVATGERVNHTYAEAGSYEVSLSVTDDRGDTTVSTQTITVKAPQNLAPVGDISLTMDGLGISVDGSGSTDPDGSISSYAWTFGDGATATGAKASHTYAFGGTYTVALTVTDNGGQKDVVTQIVTVNTNPVLASDSFSRVETNGWGTAERGGSWTTSGGAAAFSADGGGKLAMQPSWSRQAYLPQVKSTSARTSTTVSWDKGFEGGPQSVTLIGRQVGDSYYGARVRVEAGGVVRLYILRDETALGGSYVVPNYSYAPGDIIRLSLDVTGTDPTTVAATLWMNDAPMPAEPTLSGTDSTAGLQATGSVGLKVTTAAASVGERVLTIDNFLVVDPGEQLAPNESPTARFTSDTTRRTVSVDGSGSSDPDGSIADYAWDFGDGTKSNGEKVTHTYAKDGVYTIRLTVTDDAGATHSHAATVTITTPLPTVIARDLFERSDVNGWGTALTGGKWTDVGGSAAFSVADDTGIMTLAPSHSREARLSAVSTTSALSTLKLALQPGTAGAATNVTVIGRQVGADYYGGRVRFEADGSVRLYALRTETALANSFVLPGYTYQSGDVLNVKVEVMGTAPTTVRVKVWVAGTDEPTAWQISATDSQASLQQAGSVGLRAAVGAASINPTTQIRFEEYEVTDF